jgi:predicted transcriptional regulator
MAKGLPVSFTLEQRITERLHEYSKRTRIPKTAIVEMALNDYLEIREAPHEEQLSDYPE